MEPLVEKIRTDSTTLNFSVNIEAEPGLGLGRNLLWNQAGGTWNTETTNANWLANSQATFFILGDQVTFGNTGVGNVVIAGSGIAPDAIQVLNNSGNYVFSGGVIGGSTGLEKSGAGTLALANNNTYTGSTTILDGILALETQGQISPVSLINNDAVFKILHGEHVVGDIVGTGSTEIEEGELTVRSICQDALSISPGATLIVQPLSGSLAEGSYGVIPVPEPVGSAWIIGLTLWLVICSLQKVTGTFCAKHRAPTGTIRSMVGWSGL